jgi:DNA-binding NarL/FixJ family response regulator
MTRDIRVLLADDHPVYRKGLRAVLEAAPHIRVIGDVDDGEAALDAMAAGTPDVAILDLDMPRKDGLQVAAAARERRLAVKIVLLTGHKSELVLNKALDTGVSGYVLKDGALTEILDCLRAVQAGQRYVSPALSTMLLNRRARAEDLTARTPSLDDLTTAERKVLALVAQGKTSREIGELLFISPRTAENHRASIAAKLNLHGTNALVMWALEHKSELST